jgi:flagellar basal body rod protein FlgF
LSPGATSLAWGPARGRGVSGYILVKFTPTTGSSEGTISMTEGEDLSLMEEDKGDGWTRVRRKQGGEGYVPTSYLRVTLN